MARRKRVGGKHRHGGGRKYDPNARRHRTPRRGEDDSDYGSPLLRAKKLVTTGREDVEMTPAGVLYGHDHLDNVQYSALGWVTELLQRIARSFGSGASPAGIWAVIIAAASRTTPGMPAKSSAICFIFAELVLAFAFERPHPAVGHLMSFV